MSLPFPWPLLYQFWFLLNATETGGKEEESVKVLEGGCRQDGEHSQAPLPLAPRGAPPPRASSSAQVPPLPTASTPPFPTQMAHPAHNVRGEQLLWKKIAGIGDTLHIKGGIVEARMIPWTNTELATEIPQF